MLDWMSVAVVETEVGEGIEFEAVKFDCVCAENEAVELDIAYGLGASGCPSGICDTTKVWPSTNPMPATNIVPGSIFKL